MTNWLMVAEDDLFTTRTIHKFQCEETITIGNQSFIKVGIEGRSFIREQVTCV